MSPANPGIAADWWGGEQTYGIACRTGELVDAIEVPSWLGPFVLPAVEHYGFVVEVSRPLRTSWLFFVTPGAPRIPDLPRVASAQLHTAGAWVPLPPTPTIGGGTRWVVRHPEFRLPHSLCLQWAVVRAVTAARHARQREDSTRPRPRTPPGQPASS